MTNWVLKSRKVARPLFSWTNTGRWPLKEYTFPSRSSKATSELMCVTPAGKIGNCTCGMPKLLPHSAKKNTLLSPFCQSKPSRLIPPATYVPGRGIRSCELKVTNKDAASMTECIEQSWLFQELGTRNVEVDFGGGYLSSDGGGLILREFEHHSGLLRYFAGCFVDYRDPRYIEHSVQVLVSGSTELAEVQRVYGLILGWRIAMRHGCA